MSIAISPLPKIEGDFDILLELFTHSSLKDEGLGLHNEEYGDLDRLIKLGATAVENALCRHYFYKRPILAAEQISVEIQNAITPEKLREWCISWNIKSKFRAAPGACDILESPLEMQKFLNGYVGAMSIRNPLHQIQAWISSLVDPGAPQPLDTPPPVHEVAAKHGSQVTYDAEHVSGPAHMPVWRVVAKIDGVPFGEATAQSQKAGKEEAARSAFVAKGWGA
ncbi:hypothetical protein C8F01DRAFT_1108264 [Mycena amicta]|nr:hypothetical protein C8F01DRAFT_1108264 [Mycena amicta]